LNTEIVAGKELKLKSDAEISIYKKRNHKLSRENKVMRAALKEMTSFFEQVSSGKI
jgi:prefoldin subunit 5